MVNGHSGGFDFLKKELEMLFFGQGQYQAQAQPGFQAQPDLQQVQVLRGYSTFWPENHFTW